MGLMSREKGKRFEREIASRLRSLWPDAVVRRASQAERADNPDVFIEGGPQILSRLWLELQDAREPTPTAKLHQAMRDVAAWHDRRWNDGGFAWTRASMRLAAVVWHRLGERTTYVTTQLWIAMLLAGTPPVIDDPTTAKDVEVTMSFDAFIKLLQHAITLAMFEQGSAAA